VKEPDLREFDCDVREEDEPGASPLFSKGRHFLLMSISIMSLEGNKMPRTP